jgi:translation elongation factor EF-4
MEQADIRNPASSPTSTTASRRWPTILELTHTVLPRDYAPSSDSMDLERERITIKAQAVRASSPAATGRPTSRT